MPNVCAGEKNIVILYLAFNRRVDLLLFFLRMLHFIGNRQKYYSLTHCNHTKKTVSMITSLSQVAQLLSWDSRPLSRQRFQLGQVYELSSLGRKLVF